MILIGLGANLATAAYGPPRRGLEAALALLDAEGIRVVARSRWWLSEPVPPADVPWFVNGVASIETAIGPDALLARLFDLETRFGRVRGARNAPRALDLDLLDYEGERRAPSASSVLTLPHPRLEGRAFVLLPLAEVAPYWRHPASGLSVGELVAALPPGAALRPLPEVLG
jgi:2-amino-4-hydroxy-6-hydroxymethyldihydropteridine diphosphokinase